MLQIGYVVTVIGQQSAVSAVGERFGAKTIDLGATTRAEGASLGGAELPGG
jgi:hypothetical protein